MWVVLEVWRYTSYIDACNPNWWAHNTTDIIIGCVGNCHHNDFQCVRHEVTMMTYHFSGISFFKKRKIALNQHHYSCIWSQTYRKKIKQALCYSSPKRHLTQYQHCDIERNTYHVKTIDTILLATTSTEIKDYHHFDSYSTHPSGKFEH